MTTAFTISLDSAWSKMFLTPTQTEAYRNADADGKRIKAYGLLRSCNKALIEMAFIPSVLALTDSESIQLSNAIMTVAETFFSTSKEVKTNSNVLKEIITVFSSVLPDLRTFMTEADVDCIERHRDLLLGAHMRKTISKSDIQIEKSVSNISDIALAVATCEAEEH